VRLRHLSYSLLLAVPAAFVLHYLAHAGPALTFVVAGLGIIPLAALLGRSTGMLAAHYGPRIGGLLNATFGNAAELILGLFALHHGLYAVVKASLAGSILGNMLLVLGFSFIVGGLKHGRQKFDRRSAGLQSTLLVLAAIGLAVPTVLGQMLDRATEGLLSQEVAGVLLLTYSLNLLFTLAAPRHDEDPLSGHAERPRPAWSVRLSVAVLTGSTALIAVLSDLMVGAIESAQNQGYLTRLGMSEVFVGVVLVAVIGNAAENSTAVLMAFHNDLELSLHITLGSSLQIALLVTPVLLFTSLGIAPRPMNLEFTLLEVLALVASVIVVALVAIDGESHWMEGVLLVAVYLILAFAFYHVPVATP
jgi:Ca2+:H+ antiporter